MNFLRNSCAIWWLRHQALICWEIGVMATGCHRSPPFTAKICQVARWSRTLTFRRLRKPRRSDWTSKVLEGHHVDQRRLVVIRYGSKMGYLWGMWSTFQQIVITSSIQTAIDWEYLDKAWQSYIKYWYCQNVFGDIWILNDSDSNFLGFHLSSKGCTLQFLANDCHCEGPDKSTSRDMPWIVPWIVPWDTLGYLGFRTVKRFSTSMLTAPALSVSTKPPAL